MTRPRSRERETRRSETRERPRAKSREREEMRSVSIMEETSQGAIQKTRKQLQADPQRQHRGRCGLCHNFNGETIRNTHNHRSPCYAKAETCTYCRKHGHITEACRYKIADKKVEKVLGSLPCFACEHPNHAWNDCLRDETEENDQKEWPGGLRAYRKFKERYKLRRQEHIPEIWRRLAIHYERDRNWEDHEYDTTRERHRPRHQGETGRTDEAAGEQAIHDVESERTVVVPHRAKPSSSRRVEIVKDNNNGN